MKNQNKDPFHEFINAKDRATKSNAIEIPSIALPKGGGALKGIDEKLWFNIKYSLDRFLQNIIAGKNYWTMVYFLIIKGIKYL